VVRSNFSLLTHKGEFGHTCDICGKKFKVSRVVGSCALLPLKAEFGHTCDICGKKFKVSRVVRSTRSPTRPSSGTPVIFVAKSLW
jgi:hypothetical protein